MKIIDGNDIYQCMVRSTGAIEKHKKHLNRTNVFPVADGDTGTNLHATLRAMVGQTRPSDDAAQVLDHMTSGALSGARGNSGLIMAQFISGWNDAVNGRPRLSEKEFIDSLLQASRSSTAAVSVPTEGTILTLIDRWTAYLSEKHHGRTFPDLLEDSLEYAAEVLEHTKKQLKVLADHNVVDSGAQGFYHIIESMTHHFNGRALDALPEFSDPPAAIDHASDELGDYRYCAEALIAGGSVDPQTLRQRIQDLGDSIIVVGGKKALRLHLHTNAPEVLHQRLVDDGYTILETKVDDMQIQLLDQKTLDRRIGLVTDSIADLPDALIEKHRIHVLPILLTIGESQFIDKITVKPSTFYDLSARTKEQPRSGIPSPKRARTLFDDLFSVYDDVLFLSVSGKLSGMHQLIKGLQEEYKGRLHLLDTRLNSGAQGLIVKRAAEKIAQGLSLEKLIADLSSAIDRTRIYVGVDTLKYMVRGGRVPPTLGVIGKILNLKPIVSLDSEGAGMAFGKAFSRKGVFKKIRSLLESDLPVEDLCIVHGNAPERAQEWKDCFEKELGLDVSYIAEISSVVAASSGPGATAIAYIAKEAVT